MPELPEVETVCRTIHPYVVGRTIDLVEVREDRLRRPIEPDLASRLSGRRIVDVRRRAKWVLLDLGGEEYWAIHLGMSGRLCVGPPPPGLTHVHVVARFAPSGSLYFRDPRRFGRMLVAQGEADLGPLGIEPLGPEFSAERLWALRGRHRRRTVKALLMDSRLIAGVGNIYANEALFEAGVRPGRRCVRVTRREMQRLALAVPGVLRRAIESGGSSLADYRDAEGRLGEFQQAFKVYGRDGEPCRVCGAIVRGRLVAGRSSFYCPRCQV